MQIMIQMQNVFSFLTSNSPSCESHQIMLPDFLLPRGKDSMTSDFSCKNTQHQFFVSVLQKKSKLLLSKKKSSTYRVNSQQCKLIKWFSVFRHNLLSFYIIIFSPSKVICLIDLFTITC